MSYEEVRMMVSAIMFIGYTNLVVAAAIVFAASKPKR